MGHGADYENASSRRMDNHLITRVSEHNSLPHLLAEKMTPSHRDGVVVVVVVVVVVACVCGVGGGGGVAGVMGGLDFYR